MKFANILMRTCLWAELFPCADSLEKTPSYLLFSKTVI
jgi:hypothetical protein